MAAASFLVYIATASMQPSFDVYAAHLASWRIVNSGVPWFDGLPIPRIDDSDIRWVWVVDGANGHTSIGRALGTIAAGLPAYLLLGQGGFSNLPGAITAGLLMATTLALVIVTWRPWVGRTVSLVSALVFGFTTPVWSVAANGIWPHTLTVLGITGMSWASSTRRWWLVGLFGGVTLWGRLHAAIIVAILGLALTWTRRDPRIAVKVGSVSALLLGLMCVWSRWMYGSWDPTSSYDASLFVGYAEKNHLGMVNQLGLWISPDRGMLLWTPLLLVLLPALWRSWSTQPDWTRILLVGGLAYTLLQGALNRFSGGDQYYSYRLTLEMLTCALPGLVIASRFVGTWGLRLLLPVTAVQFVMILVGAVGDGQYIVASEDAWAENGFILALQAHTGVISALLVVLVAAAMLLNGTRLSPTRATFQLAVPSTPTLSRTR
jgi:alpha-1,2-mannosyltransferase